MFFLPFSIMLRRRFDDLDFIVVFSFFFHFLRNLGNMAKIILYALSISKKYNMIAFLTLKEFCRRMALMVSCYMPIRYSMVATRVSWLSKWQTIKAFHIGVELQQGCVLFLLFFIYLHELDWNCNQADVIATIGNWKISCLLYLQMIWFCFYRIWPSAHIK